MELSLTQCEEIRGLQQDTDTQAERLVILSNRQRFFNLKFRGIKEGAEENNDLIIYMATWLAKTLNVEDQCAPDISQAYRVGKMNDPKKSFPRDIVVTFKDIRVKNTILKLTLDKGYMLHLNDRIQVYTDLAPEALNKKRELREVLMALWEAKIKHRWATPLKLQLTHKGRVYFIKNESEGYEVLQLLGISMPMATEKFSNKRKITTPAQSPEKQPKYYRNFEN